jgi:hypothetical protein
MAGVPHRFVYYRVRRESARQAEAAAQEMQTQCVAGWPGLRARLMRRVGDGAAGSVDVTLMEVYEGLPSPDAAAEIERLAQARLAPWLAGARHVEEFEQCA